MENFPLHKAHDAAREAVKLQRKGLFDQAIDAHLTAANFLTILIERIPKNSSVICSLEEQSKYHKRQAELGLIVKNTSEKALVKRAVMAEKNNERTAPPNFQMNRVLSAIAQHEVQILKNIDVADSLLQILDNECPASPMSGKSSNAQAKPGGFIVRPRKDAEVIEELKTVNENLKSLVDSLMKQLHDCREENKKLKAKLEIYESNENSLDKLTPTTSLVHSAIYKALPDRRLPELAPLEEPVFDFSTYF